MEVSSDYRTLQQYRTQNGTEPLKPSFSNNAQVRSAAKGRAERHGSRQTCMCPRKSYFISLSLGFLICKLNLKIFLVCRRQLALRDSCKDMWYHVKYLAFKNRQLVLLEKQTNKQKVKEVSKLECSNNNHHLTQ